MSSAALSSGAWRDGSHPILTESRASDAVGRRGARAVADRDVGVSVEAVADSAHGAHDVFVSPELRAEAAHVHVDRALAGGAFVAGLPQGSDEFGALDGAA